MSLEVHAFVWITQAVNDLDCGYFISRDVVDFTTKILGNVFI
jgi:hypothetical protein